MEIYESGKNEPEVQMIPKRVDFNEDSLIKIIKEDLKEAGLSWVVEAYGLKIELNSFQIKYKEKKAIVSIFYTLRREKISLVLEATDYKENDPELYEKVSEKFIAVIKDLVEKFSNSEEISNSINKILEAKKVTRVESVESKAAEEPEQAPEPKNVQPDSQKETPNQENAKQPENNASPDSEKKDEEKASQPAPKEEEQSQQEKQEGENKKESQGIIGRIINGFKAVFINQ